MNCWCCLLSKYDSSNFSQSSTFAPEVSSTMLDHRTPSKSEIIGQHDATPLITYDNLTTTITLTCHCCSLVHNARPKPSTVSRHAQSTIWVAYNSLIQLVCLSVRPKIRLGKPRISQPVTSHLWSLRHHLLPNNASRIPFQQFRSLL